MYFTYFYLLILEDMLPYICIFYYSTISCIIITHWYMYLTIKGFWFYHLGPVCTAAEASDSREARNSSRQTAGDARAKL